MGEFLRWFREHARPDAEGNLSVSAEELKKAYPDVLDGIQGEADRQAVRRNKLLEQGMIICACGHSSKDHHGKLPGTGPCYNGDCMCGGFQALRKS